MSHYRSNLRSSVAASAAPCGYTITVWSSGTVTFEALGPPELGQVLLFVAGAVLAFLMVESAAYGSFQIRLASGEPPAVTVWGSAHFLSAGVSVSTVWLAAHTLGTAVAWPAAGFLATLLYLLLNALQVTLATERGGEEGVVPLARNGLLAARTPGLRRGRGFRHASRVPGAVATSSARVSAFRRWSATAW